VQRNLAFRGFVYAQRGPRSSECANNPAMQTNEPAPSHPRHVWMQRFGGRLLSLQPHTNARYAARHALDAFRDAAHLEPEAAAERFNVEALEDESGFSD